MAEIDKKLLWRGVVIFTKDTRTGIVTAVIDRWMACECENETMMLNYAKYQFSQVKYSEVLEVRVIDEFLIHGYHRLTD